MHKHAMHYLHEDDNHYNEVQNADPFPFFIPRFQILQVKSGECLHKLLKSIITKMNK